MGLKRTVFLIFFLRDAFNVEQSRNSMARTELRHILDTKGVRRHSSQFRVQSVIVLTILDYHFAHVNFKYYIPLSRICFGNILSLYVTLSVYNDFQTFCTKIIQSLVWSLRSSRKIYPNAAPVANINTLSNRYPDDLS